MVWHRFHLSLKPVDRSNVVRQGKSTLIKTLTAFAENVASEADSIKDPSYRITNPIATSSLFDLNKYKLAHSNLDIVGTVFLFTFPISLRPHY